MAKHGSVKMAGTSPAAKPHPRPRLALADRVLAHVRRRWCGHDTCDAHESSAEVAHYQKLIALVCTVGEAHHTHGSEVGSHFVPFALITTASQHGMQPPQHGTEATPTLAKRPRNSPVQLVHCVGAVETEQTEAFSGNDVQSPAERIDARAVARPGEHGFPLPPPLSCDMTAVICWPAEQSRPRSRCVFTVVEARTSQSHEPCEQQKRTVWHPSN